MSSVFFQISRFDFMEAGKIYGSNNEFGLRIVSFNNGQENYVYLPEVTLNELSLLVSLLRLRLVPGVKTVYDLRKYAFGTYYYY